MLSGNDGNDWLNAFAGDDQLYGGNDADVLLGDQAKTNWDGGLGVDRLVAIDNVLDQIIPQPSGAITVERDELWIDNLDRLGSLLAVTKVQAQHPDSVHVVGQYRAYDAFSIFQTQPALTWGLENLIDPDAREQHQANSTLNKKDFGDSPLFGPNGPVWNDIDQGAVGTCYFLARLAALANTHPQNIRDMITELGDGTFVVQFSIKKAIECLSVSTATCIEIVAISCMQIVARQLDVGSYRRKGLGYSSLWLRNLRQHQRR